MHPFPAAPLPPLQQAVRDFEATFAAYGLARHIICPAYGLAEHVAFVCGHNPRTPMMVHGGHVAVGVPRCDGLRGRCSVGVDPHEIRDKAQYGTRARAAVDSGLECYWSPISTTLSLVASLSLALHPALWIHPFSRSGGVHV